MRWFYEEIFKIIQNSAKLCYVHYDKRHFYPEMYENILRLNTFLYNIRKKRVALFAEKSFENYCGVFAILLSENTWIPINPLQPEIRNLHMLQLAEPSIIITDRPLTKTMDAFAKERGIKIIALYEILADDAVCEVDLGEFSPNDTAYIMFTSGSTGVPKGVPMTHINYINFIQNAMEILPLEKQEVFSDFHDLGFDISIFYLFCCILTESAFVPSLSEMEQFLPIDSIIQNNVTVWSTVPSAISRLMMLRPDDKIETNLKIMFLCGEPFRLEVLDYCYRNLSITHIYNFYGLTETGVENFYHKCQPTDLKLFQKQGFVPVGKPLSGNDILVTEEKELLVSGCQVTPGYLGEIGQERFEVIDGIRWFRSGDIFEKFDDLYFCKGRLDSQVKIDGYRVELMDIEVNLRRYEGIRDAICLLDEKKERNLLIAWIETDSKIDSKALTAFLKQYLPQPLIPKEYHFLRQFPKNANDKIDRIAIKDMYDERIDLRSE
jgi:acyl-CoA synthetase (AMP-forming)/AMP-acid ligase II